MSHQVKSWFGASVPNVAAHPAVRALATKWLQIKTERDPVLADFWHYAEDTLVNSSILFIKGESDYTYLHHGRLLRDRIGFSMQGLALSELRTRVRDQLIEIYDRAANEFTIAYFQSFADFQQEVMLWGRLCLPLRLSASDPRTVILLYCHAIEDKASIFRALFERSQSGGVIAAPVRDDQGTMVDAWIIAQNAEAGNITGVREHVTDDLLLRSTAIFGRDDLWAHLITHLDHGATVATVNDPARELSISVYAEMVDEYLVLRLTRIQSTESVFLID